MKQTDVQLLALELDVLSSAKTIYPNGPCGNTIGCESYRLVADGFAFACLDDAARKLLDLEEANAELLAALQAAFKALDAIFDEMTVGERYTNAGQYLIDAFPVVREALEKHGGK